MRRHIELLLASAEPLSFVVVIPCWRGEGESEGAGGDPQRQAAWTALQDSAFNRKHVLLAQVNIVWRRSATFGVVWHRFASFGVV